MCDVGLHVCAEGDSFLLSLFLVATKMAGHEEYYYFQLILTAAACAAKRLTVRILDSSAVLLL